MFKLVINNKNDNCIRVVDGLYVSCEGDIFNKRWRKLSQKIYWRYLCIKQGTKPVGVHRLVAMAFPEICGEWFDGCEVDHLDGNIFNNRVSNLLVCTHKENMNNPNTLLKMSISRKKYLSRKCSAICE